jgi:hypothetical protein
VGWGQLFLDNTRPPNLVRIHGKADRIYLKANMKPFRRRRGADGLYQSEIVSDILKENLRLL